MASTTKRKRRGSVRQTGTQQPPCKKARTGESQKAPPPASLARHAVISQYYPSVLSLRQYMLAKLPSSSRIRRKKISTAGRASQSSDGGVNEIEESVGRLLDTTLIGLPEQTKSNTEDLWDQWTSFSQRGDESTVTLSDGLAGAAFSQSEIVDFSIWQLFTKTKAAGSWPKHVLCDGFRRDHGARFQEQAGARGTNIPGIFSIYENQRVKILKESPWPELLKLLGQSGDRIMISMLLNCAVFLSVKSGQGNYYQISGLPLNDAEVLVSAPNNSKSPDGFRRSPSDISFIRNRMLYARAALNARGLVHFGLRHIHVLNLSPYASPDSTSTGSHQELLKRNEANTLRVMMYLFPRQLGLHNVFTSKVDLTETAQRLKDYTLREQEIQAKFGRFGGDDSKVPTRLPKRLRGDAQDLTRKMQIQHSRCSYSKLLQHYCPASPLVEPKECPQGGSSKAAGCPRGSEVRPAKKTPHTISTEATAAAAGKAVSIVDLSSPASHVSAFCQSVVSNVIPDKFWGNGSVQKHNKRHVLHKIDQFVHMRRFESLSLHEVMQGMKITDIEWLAPPRLMAHKTSQTDIQKRGELFYEFLYYVFDSLLIPLIRSNFYVTESNTHKNRLFFFRHDVWRYVVEPAMAKLKSKMFEEVSLGAAMNILQNRSMGFSQIRLLPKVSGIRPIMNLRRRMVSKGDRKALGPSINTILGPVHTVLQLEKTLDPGRLGSTLFSVGDVYKRLKAFKSTLSPSTGPLYFAKVDVQAAFDTIPQSAIVGLLDSIPQQRHYRISKHVELASNDPSTAADGKLIPSRPSRKWHATAARRGDKSTFFESLDLGRAEKKRNTVFIDSVVQRKYETSDLLSLVASHIQQNLVKIGKKYYRQKQGIPQGSVLSSTLCNYFYADLEMQVLAFLDSSESLLLRLIDDFLLITPDKAKAVRFVETMHRGVPEYGVSVNPAKTLTNFDLTVHGVPVANNAGRSVFPYCGTLINCKTLDITKDHDREALGPVPGKPGQKDGHRPKGTRAVGLYDSLTVDMCRTPGQAFERKVLNVFKMQGHLMFLDTALNAPATVLANLREAFGVAAAKLWAYMRCLPSAKRPTTPLVIRTLGRLVDVAFRLATSRARRTHYPDYVCDVSKREVAWLGYHAFLDVLGRKQTTYGPVLHWLRAEIRKLAQSREIRQGRVRHVARDRVFSDARAYG